ncbi:tryptophan synthase beta subunit-like PLP-dependent enzyme [Boletus reticuloceps]|uniref:Tryptophan synthase beta subunit-like PLP-dependent enzyme n=1 Tax=Boletus reticuloceps TaxID=495285 RepID=A0A8I2YNW0_9AGAM|nr:tryptophan synthase beta subunit-like PLP-dependent enzyme [Boletus reticuloceps]
MKYFSTRGHPGEQSFEDVVLAGLAPDGGLYIPKEIPTLPENWRSEWAGLSYQQLAINILSLFISPDELPPADLVRLVNKTYTVGPSVFRHPSITPLVQLDPKTHILELYHGPTYAFKDLALQLVGNLFEYFLDRRNSAKSPGEPPEKLTVVGATSGDTGSAAIYGLRNKANISVFILFPQGRVSPIQEAQMTTVLDENVHNLSVSGTFDNCQDILKTLLSDKGFNEKHHLGAVNSINWARILVQIVYYFSAYFQLLCNPDVDVDHSEIQFVVPTGNFGDILAGYYAKRMGLPMGKLGVATNSNDILARFWTSGTYQKVDPNAGHVVGGVYATISPAMDIAVSSNFERLLWYLAYEIAVQDDKTSKRAAACEQVRNWMVAVKNRGTVDLSAVLEGARKDFVADKANDEQTVTTIRKYYETRSYLADPHTAVGLYAAEVFAKSNSTTTVQVVLSTAHPAKFAEAVQRAHPSFDLETVFGDLLSRERRVHAIVGAEEELIGLVRNAIDKIASGHRP